MLYDNLEGCEGMRFKREGLYVCLQLIHFTIQQKLTQYCKAIILKLKINFLKRKKSTVENKQTKNPQIYIFVFKCLK